MLREFSNSNILSEIKIDNNEKQKLIPTEEISARKVSEKKTKRISRNQNTLRSARAAQENQEVLSSPDKLIREARANKKMVNLLKKF